MSAYKKLKIKSIFENYPGFKTISFENDHGIEYKSGQYLTLVKEHNGEEIRRSYSTVSSPVLNEDLAIGVKRVENGFFSRQLVDHAKVGDEITTSGAGGFFTLPDDIENYEQIFFFAAGSGITPVLSIIKTAIELHPNLKLVLVYSTPSPLRAAFYVELQRLETQALFRNFKSIPLFSNDPDLYRAHLHRDLLLELFNVYKVHDTNKILFYTCGPESYMRMVTWTLQENGISADHIRKENFVIHTALKEIATPPDRSTRTVVIEVYREQRRTIGGRKPAVSPAERSEVRGQRSEIGSERYEVEVIFPDSILKAAKKQGIVLPYSCEAGRCGNCVAKCISGEVWHSNNEVLTDADLAKGLVLTCVGHPVGDGVVLRSGS